MFLDNTNIYHHGGKNIGSFLKLLIIKRKYVLSIHYRKDNPDVVEEILLQQGSKFNEIQFSAAQYGIHTEIANISTNGVKYAQTINVKIRRDKLEYTNWLRYWVNAQVICIIEDLNGDKKLVGELNAPLVLSNDFHRGATPDALNHHFFKITGFTKHLSAWFEWEQLPQPQAALPIYNDPLEYDFLWDSWACDTLGSGYKIGYVFKIKRVQTGQTIVQTIPLAENFSLTELFLLSKDYLTPKQIREAYGARKVYNQDCLTCYEPLPEHEHYAELSKQKENWMVSIHGELHCFKFKNEAL